MLTKVKTTILWKRGQCAPFTWDWQPNRHGLRTPFQNSIWSNRNTQHQGCQIFLGSKYQNGKKCTKLQSLNYNKRPYNGPSVHKIYQHLPLLDPPKFTQIGVSGLKTNHLATLPNMTVHQLSRSNDGLLDHYRSPSRHSLHMLEKSSCNLSMYVICLCMYIHFYDVHKITEPVLRLLNLQLQRRRCGRLERIFK
jgi:hypothetical protein